MGRARDHMGVGETSGMQGLRLVFPGDTASVRGALKDAMAAIDGMELAQQVFDTAEIVLAEVLNNVVEHAYAEHGRGVIEIEIARVEDGLAVWVRDDGQPMPADELPEGRPHDLDVPADQLPEGGFGWHLIRSLTEELQYRRSANRNELRFRITPRAMPRRS
jgi:serine/threonine-protein kinase RsbW